jgi:hypothetical protein
MRAALTPTLLRSAPLCSHLRLSCYCRRQRELGEHCTVSSTTHDIRQACAVTGSPSVAHRRRDQCYHDSTVVLTTDRQERGRHGRCSPVCCATSRVPRSCRPTTCSCRACAGLRSAPTRRVTSVDTCAMRRDVASRPWRAVPLVSHGPGRAYAQVDIRNIA